MRFDCKHNFIHRLMHWLLNWSGSLLKAKLCGQSRCDHFTAAPEASLLVLYNLFNVGAACANLTWPDHTCTNTDLQTILCCFQSLGLCLILLPSPIFYRGERFYQCTSGVQSILGGNQIRGDFTPNFYLFLFFTSTFFFLLFPLVWCESSKYVVQPCFHISSAST